MRGEQDIAVEALMEKLIANGAKPKRVDTPAGTLAVNVPNTGGHDEPFYPQSLERGRRSSRALPVSSLMMTCPSRLFRGSTTRPALT